MAVAERGPHAVGPRAAKAERQAKGSTNAETALTPRDRPQCRKFKLRHYQEVSTDLITFHSVCFSTQNQEVRLVDHARLERCWRTGELLEN